MQPRQTILRHLKKANPKAQFVAPESANAVMDTTCFGCCFGVMALFDSISGKALSVIEVKNETNALYAQAIGSLKVKDIEIQSIVCDGRKGLPQLFPDIPVQLCHFRQVKTVGRYLTRNPQTAAGKELRRLALSLKSSRRADFEGSLKAWFKQHKDFLRVGKVRVVYTFSGCPVFVFRLHDDLAGFAVYQELCGFAVPCGSLDKRQNLPVGSATEIRKM